MTPETIPSKVQELQASCAVGKEAAWAELGPLGVAVCPYLLAAYPTFTRSQGRVALVFHAIRFARQCPEAFELGVLALSDRATLVRYRACAVLAYAQRQDALPFLQALLLHPDPKTVADAAAAMDAIRAKNHHLFMDRTHSGKVFWEVVPGDLPSKSAVALPIITINRVAAALVIVVNLYFLPFSGLQCRALLSGRPFELVIPIAISVNLLLVSAGLAWTSKRSQSWVLLAINSIGLAWAMGWMLILVTITQQTE